MKPKNEICIRLFLFMSICILLASCLAQKSKLDPGNISPAIAALDIPKDGVSYPDDWPEDLRFPKVFTLVETSSGKSVGGSSQGWTAMYRIKGSVDEAEASLRKHFLDLGWQIPAVEKQEESGYMFLLEKGESNGFIVIEADPDKRNQTLIMATFFQ